MHLGFHGGLCCGIKTIHGFGWGPTAPDDKVGKLSEVPRPFGGEDGDDFHTSSRFYCKEAPKETNLERLDRYLAYLEDRKEAGAVEATIAINSDWWSQEVWIPLLEERGFKEAARFYNSNSGSTVVWFIKTWDNRPKEDKE